MCAEWLLNWISQASDSRIADCANSDCDVITTGQLLCKPISQSVSQLAS